MEAWTWLQEAARQNILPLTSVCNVHCRFCSHYQNPPQVQTVEIPPLPEELIEKLLGEIYPEEPLIIGESVTRIREGECFTHPQIRAILKRIRGEFPQTEIRLTTNGSLLDEEMIKFLAGLGKIRLTLSLNTASAANRRFLMGDSQAKQAVKAPFYLQKYQIPFQGSLVAMPQLVGWEDLEQTIAYLAQNGAETVRIFRPGYTRYGAKALKGWADYEAELFQRVTLWQKQFPLTLEPPQLQDLQAQISGVIKNSPAEQAGLQSGDLLTAIGGEKPFSRVEAFELLRQSGSVQLQISRQGKEQKLFLPKLPSSSSGIIMDYDLDPRLLSKVKRAIKPWRQKRILWLCSQLGEKVLQLGAAAKLADYDLKIKAAANDFLGGSIACAGLLTVPDLLKALEGENPEAIILPQAAFDSQGRDLLGQSQEILKDFAAQQRTLIKLL